MTMARVLEAEALDHLAEHDPVAQASRRDLRRIHRAMATRSILLRAFGRLQGLSRPAGASAPLRVLELGAGDGSLMLGVAQALAARWPTVELTLLDRQSLVSDDTLAGYAATGWRATVQVADVIDWAAGRIRSPADAGGTARWDLIVANLFLHHFEGSPLAALLAAVGSRSNRFVACEPRRGWLALAGSHLVGALGANAVTRSDAVLSVRAGFRDHELSAAWPSRADWQIREHAVGPFSHCFTAERLGAGR